MPYLDYTNENGVVSKIEWTPLSEKPIKPSTTPLGRAPTLGEEVETLMRDWYKPRNMTISPSEIQACRQIDIDEAAQQKKDAAIVAPTPFTYGTPEFWKDWWAKKRAKEALEPGVEPKAKPKPKTPRVPKSAKQTAPA